MSEQKFLKSLLQQQTVKLENPNFTDNVLRKINVRQKRQQIMQQLIISYILCGVGIGFYFFIQPYFVTMTAIVTKFWYSLFFDILLSFPYLITYFMIAVITLFFYYDSQHKVPFNL